METPQVSAFRQFVLDGRWDKVEETLSTLGVSDPVHFIVSVSFFLR